MGFIKETKNQMVANAAKRALDDGRQTFVAMLNQPALQAYTSGGIDDWSGMIDAIEAAGWRLDQWAVSTDQKGRPQAYPLFRRA